MTKCSVSEYFLTISPQFTNRGKPLQYCHVLLRRVHVPLAKVATSEKVLIFLVQYCAYALNFCQTDSDRVTAVVYRIAHWSCRNPYLTVSVTNQASSVEKLARLTFYQMLQQLLFSLDHHPALLLFRQSISFTYLLITIRKDNLPGLDISLSRSLKPFCPFNSASTSPCMSEFD